METETERALEKIGRLNALDATLADAIRQAEDFPESKAKTEIQSAADQVRSARVDIARGYQILRGEFVKADQGGA